MFTTSLSNSTEAVTSLSTADFDGDGFADVLVTRTDYPTYNTFPLQILLGDGRGGFHDGTSRNFEGAPPSVQVPREVVIADLNNDDIGSIYTESHDEPPEILLNDGTGRFSVCGDCLPRLLSDPVVIGGQPLHGPTYTGSQFVDVNNDGAPDLVLAGNGYYRVPSGIVTSDSQVLLNDASGHFSVLPGALPPRPWNDTAEGVDVRAADLNHDGHQDLLISYTPQDPYYVGRWIQVLTL